MSDHLQPGTPIYHLALEGEWREALDSGQSYRCSTLGRTLTEVGFIHCSFASQVPTIADAFYRGRHDVVLLEIDATRIEDEVRVEPVQGGGGSGQSFPHIYGPLPVSAVVRATEVPVDADGHLRVDGLLGAA